MTSPPTNRKRKKSHKSYKSDSKNDLSDKIGAGLSNDDSSSDMSIAIKCESRDWGSMENRWW